MHDSLDVGCVERICDLNAEVQNFFERERLALNATFQGLSIQELHRNEVLTVLFTDVVNRVNVRVVECRSGFSLALETFQQLRIIGQISWKKFQGDRTVQARVLRLVDHTHTPASEFFQNPVMRDGLANHEELCVAMCRGMLGRWSTEVKG